MAMPLGNLVLSDKMSFPSGVGNVGGEIHHRQWYPDERDEFISWLRGEFAAANVIIDSLCHHLRSIGDLGEYDSVIGCIQQRRYNWNSVLHMQKYFSVAEVIDSLHHVSSRKQQRHKDYRRHGIGFNKPAQRFEPMKEAHNSSVESQNYNGNNSGFVGSEKKVEPGSQKCEEVRSVDKVEKLDDDNGAAFTEEKNDAVAKAHTYSIPKSLGISEGNKSGSTGPQVEVADEGCTPSPQENDMHSNQNLNEEDLTASPKTFVANEMFDGKPVNVVDGLKLYEELFKSKEVSSLVSMVNDMRALGKKGQLQGQTYAVSKRPMKGHGREMLQLGLPISFAPSDEENASGTSKDRRADPIPPLLQDVIERLVGMQVFTLKPDSCIIDIYNEGDHSQPHVWPPWFGRPVAVLFLTECEMTFGRVIGVNHPGDYRGSLKLSLSPGSLLSMQGKSADFAKHAIPSIRKQRILVTLIKSQPKKATEGQHLPSAAAAPSSHWGPRSRSANHIPSNHITGNKQYPAVVPSTGVLQAQPIHPQIMPQITPPNGFQPLFVPTPRFQPMPFPTTPYTAPPRNPPPRLLAPGTGVFLPPSGTGNPSPQQILNAANETNFTIENGSLLEKENGTEEPDPNTSASPKGKSDGNAQRPDCNGSVDATGSGKAALKEEQQQSGDSVLVSNPVGAV